MSGTLLTKRSLTDRTTAPGLSTEKSNSGIYDNYIPFLTPNIPGIKRVW